jgi:hypothetical protein
MEFFANWRRVIRSGFWWEPPVTILRHGVVGCGSVLGPVSVMTTPSVVGFMVFFFI